MEDLTLAEQMSQQRRAWRVQAFERWVDQRDVIPPARSLRADLEAEIRRSVVDGRIETEVPWVHEPIRRTPMPAQEDEITLLDDAPERAAPRRAALPNVTFQAFREPDVDDLNISEISMSEAAALTKRKGRKGMIKLVPEKPQPILHRGCVVHAKDSTLYSGDNRIAYASYAYLNPDDEDVEAVSMMHGNTPVFCTSKAELAKFKALLERVDITVVEGKSLCFFSGTEFYAGDDYAMVIVSDGEIVRYGGRNGDERIMRLTNPIDQKPDQIFTAITGFATKSVAGATQALANEKARLKAVSDRRSEDVFLYLSDLTPPEDKADVHAFAMSRLEEAYNADLTLARQIKAQVTTFTDKINKAKSQIPNGRKGVPLRNSYLRSPVVTEQLDFFKVIRDGFSLKVIFAFKKDLILQNINYGRPEVTINMSCHDGHSRRGGTFILETNGVQVRSADRNAFMHPHIEGTTRWCLGTYIGPINNAIMGGNVPLAASLLWKYLSNYNPESPLIRIESCRDQMANARPRDLIVRRK